MFDFSMVRVVFDPSRGVGRERCNTLLTAVSDDEFPVLPVPVAGERRPSGGGWTRRLSIETSGGAIFSRLYAASSDSGGRVHHAPTVWCPAGWVAGWEPQFCIDGTMLFAVCVRRTVRDVQTQTEEAEMKNEKKEEEDDVTRVVPESPLNDDDMMSSSLLDGRGAIDPQSDDSLCVFTRPLTPAAPPASTNVTPGSLDDDEPEPEVDDDRLSQMTPPPQVIPGNVMLSPPVPTIAVGPPLPAPSLRAPPRSGSSKKPNLRVLRQMLLTSMTGVRRTLLCTPSKAVLLQRRSGDSNANAGPPARDNRFATLFDDGLRSVRRPSVLIRQTRPCGQHKYYVCLPMAGDRAATDDKIGGLELLKLPFGSGMVATKMPHLARILLANTNQQRHGGSGFHLPCVPRLARFKISLPAYKFMKNHVEKTTPSNWVSHPNPRYSDLAILTDKRLADSTFDTMVERILAGH
jgi:hypothetical protein